MIGSGTTTDAVTPAREGGPGLLGPPRRSPAGEPERHPAVAATTARVTVSDALRGGDGA